MHRARDREPRDLYGEKIPLIASMVINFPLAVHDSSQAVTARARPRSSVRRAELHERSRAPRAISPAMLIFSLIRCTRKWYTAAATSLAWRPSWLACAANVGWKCRGGSDISINVYCLRAWEEVYRSRSYHDYSCDKCKNRDESKCERILCRIPTSRMFTTIFT